MGRDGARPSILKGEIVGQAFLPAFYKRQPGAVALQNRRVDAANVELTRGLRDLGREEP